MDVTYSYWLVGHCMAEFIAYLNVGLFKVWISLTRAYKYQFQTIIVSFIQCVWFLSQKWQAYIKLWKINCCGQIIIMCLPRKPAAWQSVTIKPFISYTCTLHMYVSHSNFRDSCTKQNITLSVTLVQFASLLQRAPHVIITLNLPYNLL